MLRKTKLIMAAAVLGSVSAGIAVPVALTYGKNIQTQQTTPQTLPENKSTGASKPAGVSYAASSLNTLPGPETNDIVLTAPTPPVFTDTVSLSYQATSLPLPKLPIPAPGYAPWSPQIAYTIEGTNEPVTNEKLPTLPAGTVVLAVATTSPGEGHAGPAYTATVRFVIQKVLVRQQRAVDLSATRYEVLTTLEKGKLPLDELKELVPPSLVDKGYFPWSKTRLAVKFVDKGGRSYSLTTTADWAYLASRFQNAAEADLFSIRYVWQTEPDFNHYADGWDGIVNYEYRVDVAKRLQITAAASSGREPLEYRSVLVDGKEAAFTVMNQYGAMVYDVKRSEAGDPIGEIQPVPLAESTPVTLADGKDYPVFKAGSAQDTELYDYWAQRKSAPKLDVNSELWKGASFVSKAMTTSNFSLPGTDFNIFNAIPSDSAVSTVPLVTLTYQAKSAEAAVKLLSQLKITFKFINSVYFVTPNPLSPEEGGLPLPTVNSVQRFLTKPAWPYHIYDTQSFWYNEWAKNTNPVSTSPHNFPDLLDYQPISSNTNVGMETAEIKAMYYGTNYNERWNLETKDRFVFNALDRYNIDKGQFFDVTSLTFVPEFTNYYSDAAKGVIRSRLFDPESTTLRVGAYVEYKNGRLLMYLIPYISNLPKISFAPVPRGLPINRNLGFAYRFQDVTMSLDAKNDTSLGWWS